MTMQEYFTGVAIPTVIQISVLDAGDNDGYGGVRLNMFCSDISGIEIMRFPITEGADHDQNVCHELAKTLGVSPVSLQVINARGETLRCCLASSLSDFAG